MPNWTNNYLYFVGEDGKAKKDYEAFKEVLVSRDLERAKEDVILKNNDGYFVDFNKLIPMPKCLDIRENDFAIVYYLTNKLTIPIEKLDSKTTKLLYTLVNNPFHENKSSHSWAQELIYRHKETIKKSSKKELEDLYCQGDLLVSNYKTYGHMFWYTWRWDNWGTKWNACDSDFNFTNNKDELSVMFLTAWCFPDKILKELVKRVPNIELWWEIENEDMLGDPPMVAMVKNGKITVKQLLYPKNDSDEYNKFYDKDLEGFNYWNYLDEALLEGYDWDNPKWQVVSM